MGAKAGLALKALQWLIRLVQLLSAALVLAVYLYFLAALHNHGLHVPTRVRAVEGIASAAVVYSIAGLAVASAAAALLDLAFVGAFIYVAFANCRGTASCRGYLETPFGSGRYSNTAVGPNDGFTALPSFRTTCRMQTAVLAVAIVAIFFFLFSILVEFALARHHHKARRFGPGPANNYTSGYGSSSSGPAGPGGFPGRFRRNRHGPSADDNALPEHIHPAQLDDAALPPSQANRIDLADHAKAEAGYDYTPQQRHQQAGWHTAPHVQYPAANY